jgi:hypothetical protein
MKLQDIRNMDKNDFLGILGLETRSSLSHQLLGTLATFGVGLLVGAGVALLLAPKAGSELRHALRAKLHCEDKASGSGGEPRHADEARS